LSVRERKLALLDAATGLRAAQSKVVKMMIPNLGEMKDEKHFQNGW